MNDNANRRPRPSSRGHRGYHAFLAHRISGVLLAVFLPLHFLALGTALDGDAALDRFLAFTDNLLVKFAEWGLVILLGLHLGLGLRLIVLELGQWRGLRIAWVNWSAGAALALGVVFLAVLVS